MTAVDAQIAVDGTEVIAHGVGRDQDKTHAEQARALLADLGMGDKLHRFPYELSGGERQRTAMARAMIRRPRIIFADEPTGLLNRRTGLQVWACSIPSPCAPTSAI